MCWVVNWCRCNASSDGTAAGGTADSDATAPGSSSNPIKSHQRCAYGELDTNQRARRRDHSPAPVQRTANAIATTSSASGCNVIQITDQHTSKPRMRISWTPQVMPVFSFSFSLTRQNTFAQGPQVRANVPRPAPVQIRHAPPENGAQPMQQAMKGKPITCARTFTGCL